jgi:hypothetical protein
MRRIALTKQAAKRSRSDPMNVPRADLYSCNMMPSAAAPTVLLLFMRAWSAADGGSSLQMGGYTRHIRAVKQLKMHIKASTNDSPFSIRKA